MADFWAKREGNILSPVDMESAAEFGKIPFGRVVHVEVKQPRNGAHHRLYWALVHRIANSIGCNPEALSNHLKVRTGHVQTVRTRGGIVEYPASISFASMDQTAFSDFYSRCIQTICEDLGMKRPDVLDACRDLIDHGAEVRA